MRAILTLATVLLLSATVRSVPAAAQGTTRSKAQQSRDKGAKSAGQNRVTPASDARAKVVSDSAASATTSGGSMSALAPKGSITLRDAPDGGPVATLSPRVVLEPDAREHGWIRVRAQGWVRESDVASADSTRSVLSAADIRADPEGVRGRHVQWNVEVLAIATADPLRKGLNPDEPYLLVRGPNSENSLIYVAVPPSLLSSARTLAASAPVAATILATIRVGRSDPVGVPILDAQSITHR